MYMIMVTITTRFAASILTVVIGIRITIIIHVIIAIIAAIIVMLVQEPGHACHLYYSSDKPQTWVYNYRVVCNLEISKVQRSI